jgi:radical SAM-linked protein
MRQRLRIRFRKEADLRLISHRDLARLWERVFRRAELPLARSEGFHPKAKLSFPSALGLGIAGLAEVLEAELAEDVSAEEVLRRLQRQAPEGLTVVSVQPAPPGQKKAQVVRMVYELPVPAERQAATQQALEAWLAQAEAWVERTDRPVKVNLRSGVEQLELRGGQLIITLRASREASARPREVLEQLGLADLESSGAFLTRTGVELA